MSQFELIDRYKKLNVAEKLIAINIVMFLFFRLLVFLFASHTFFNWFILSKKIDSLLVKPWSIISYSFLHQDFLHLLFNMVTLYYVSKLFLTRFNSKLLLNIYLLGGIIGGLLFVLAYNVFPVFENEQSFLVGASASVMAVLVFVAAYLPQLEVSVFSFRIKLWQLGLFFVVLDILQMPYGNSGGHVAHLGGALFGYIYAMQYKNGNDIGKGFERMMDAISSRFTFQKKSKLKTVHKTKAQRRASDKTVYQKNRIKQEKIDAILDKISKSGYESLSKEEKTFLFQSGKE